LVEYFTAIKEKNIVQALTLIKHVLEEGKDAGRFAEESLTYLRNLLMKDLAPEFYKQSAVQLVESELSFEESEIFFYIDKFTQLQEKLSYTTDAEILLEVTTIQMIEGEGNQSILAQVQAQSQSQAVFPAALEEIAVLRREVAELRQALGNIQHTDVAVKKSNAKPNISPSKMEYKEPIQEIVKILPEAKKEIKAQVKNVWMDMMDMLSSPQKAKFQKYGIFAATENILVITFADEVEFLASTIAHDDALLAAVTNGLSVLMGYTFRIYTITERGQKEVVRLYRGGVDSEETLSENMSNNEKEESIVLAQKLFGDDPEKKVKIIS
jgi:DNA polymerase-3 subunit gamma/tau